MVASATNTPVFITSSSEVYGKNFSDSLKESDDRILGSPTTLRWSYSEAKAIDESLAYAYFIERKLETRIVRFFNTVGPRQLGAYGMVLPRFVKFALANEPITIYGDGNQTRDFLNVQDVAIANIKAAQSNSLTGAFNLGSGTSISINELVDLLQEVYKKKIERN
jgi:UDP-glucose 4-epimerase